MEASMCGLLLPLVAEKSCQPRPEKLLSMAGKKIATPRPVAGLQLLETLPKRPSMTSPKLTDIDP